MKFSEIRRGRMDWIIVFEDEGGEIIRTKWMDDHLTEMIKDVKDCYGVNIKWISITLAD